MEGFIAAIQWYSFRLVTDEEKQLLKVTAEAALKPFGNLLERLFGGAVDQIGGEWEDRLKARRLLRRAKVLAKLKQQLDDAGFEAQQISERVWVPALQAVSLEDDDTLQDYVSALHLPELATLINAGGWRHVRVTVPEVAGCDKIKNLVDLVAKKGH